LKEDWRHASVTPRLKQMLEYAEQVTVHPAGTKQKDIEKLQQLGLSDRDILDLNQVVAYFNYVNRVADGLGIELESEYHI
jgi:uncharacterized peroxidase-related enzyme